MSLKAVFLVNAQNVPEKNHLIIKTSFEVSQQSNIKRKIKILIPDIMLESKLVC